MSTPSDSAEQEQLDSNSQPNYRFMRLELQFGVMNETLKQNTAAVQTLTQQFSELSNRLSRQETQRAADVSRVAELPCREHLLQMGSLDRRLQVLEKELEVLRERTTAAIGPIRLLVFGAVGSVLTAVLAAILGLILLKTSITSDHKVTPVTPAAAPSK